MKLIRASSIALNQTPLDWEGNRSRILKGIQIARDSGSQIVCLPELSITGYGCEDAFFAPSVHEESLNILESILPETRGMIVTLGLPLLFQNAIYNTVAIACDGKLVGFVGKGHLAGDGIHYEPRWFKAWPDGVKKYYSWNGNEIPLGDIYFDFSGVRVGLEICEDAWVAARPGAQHVLNAVDIILNPSASHFAFGKQDVRERLVLEGSRAYNVSYIYSNLVGNEAGRVIYDGGLMIASGGKMVATSERLSFRDVLVINADIDLDLTRTSQARSASFSPDLSGKGEDLIKLGFDWNEPEKLLPAGDDSPQWEEGRFVKEEEFTRAVALGLFDYLRKSRSRGFVVSLSGGADSSAVAALVAYALRFARAEPGENELEQKLSYLGGVPDDEKELVRRLLTCVYQGSDNSSKETLDAARILAEDLGAEFHNFVISSLVDNYVGMVEESIGRKLAWETDDIALQNIQARVRAPGVWLMANLRNALLLSTSNRSEAAVGYATMDGDTCGGLSPIAGIDKAFLRHWLNWAEETGPERLSPVEGLAKVNSLIPTAELRPPSAVQTDEDDLMPYPVLDWIERAAIRDKQSPKEIFKRSKAEFPEAGDRLRFIWIEKFFTLWSRNQWKRERYAPSFHLDDENLDPKTWCRFPILSGSYRKELCDLKEAVEKREI